MEHRVNWWRTDFTESEIDHIGRSIRDRCVSQGKVTVEFESALCELLKVKHTICVSSGSAALVLALMAAGIKCGDEVIVPARTWIATAHAVYMLGAKPCFVDVETTRPIIDAALIEDKITDKTKAIIPVSLNGRSADMSAIRDIAKKYNLCVIEDAAQAIYSRNNEGFIGTKSDMGCFSLSVAKSINTGQGGFVVTNNDELATRLRAMRTHGVENVKEPNSWHMFGFNFRYTDVLASIGLEQIKKIDEKIVRIRDIYNLYSEYLHDNENISQIAVDIKGGEIPVYNEFMVKDREKFIGLLESKGIESRMFYPSMHRAEYFGQCDLSFPNADKYEKYGLYLPSGPSQDINDIKYVIDTINSMSGN